MSRNVSHLLPSHLTDSAQQQVKGDLFSKQMVVWSQSFNLRAKHIIKKILQLELFLMSLI